MEQRLKAARSKQVAARDKARAALDEKSACPKGDMVHAPNHYAVLTCSCGKKIEARDIINAIIEPFGGMFAHDIACGLKYLLRLGKKDDPAQELGKSLKYIGWAQQNLSAEDSPSDNTPLSLRESR